MDLNLKKASFKITKKKTLPNEFYCPDLFKILTERLYLLPLWSGLIIHNDIKHYKVNTRLSNNPAENWFEQVKYKVIKRKKVSTSEMVTPIYKRIFVKYIKVYLPGGQILDKKQLLTMFGMKESSHKTMQEVWVDKNIKQKRIKGFFFDNYEILKNLSTKYDYNFGSLSNPQFDNILRRNASYMDDKMDFEQSNYPNESEQIKTFNNSTKNMADNLKKRRIYDSTDNELFEQQVDIKSDFLSSENSTDNVLLEQNEDKNSDYIFCESSSDNQFLETEDFKSDTVQADSKN